MTKIEQPKPGHDTFVTITNAMLAARDKARLDTFNLVAVLRVLLAHGLTQADTLEALHDHGDKFMDYAELVNTDDELEVDAKPLFSEGDGGVWVSAWVWVAKPEVEEDEADDEDATNIPIGVAQR